jgi:excisionase family DNA binding protein
MVKWDIIQAKEIAGILGIKVTTLYDKRWVKQVGIPVYKNGKRLFVKRNEFEEWYNGRICYA